MRVVQTSRPAIIINHYFLLLFFKNIIGGITLAASINEGLPPTD